MYVPLSCSRLQQTGESPDRSPQCFILNIAEPCHIIKSLRIIVNYKDLDTLCLVELQREIPFDWSILKVIYSGDGTYDFICLLV